MGYMIMECGLGAFALAVFHLCAHGLFKATLFLNSGANKEVLIINDGSIDGTHEYLKTIFHECVRVLDHDGNYGKGLAIRTALDHGRGQFVTIQDADLEYAPTDLLSLLKTAQQRDSVVYGSRNFNNTNGISLGGVLLSYLANGLYKLALTDFVYWSETIQNRGAESNPIGVCGIRVRGGSDRQACHATHPHSRSVYQLQT